MSLAQKLLRFTPIGIAQFAKTKKSKPKKKKAAEEVAAPAAKGKVTAARKRRGK